MNFPYSSFDEDSLLFEPSPLFLNQDLSLPYLDLTDHAEQSVSPQKSEIPTNDEVHNDNITVLKRKRKAAGKKRPSASDRAERNRRSARESRERKKQYIESLQMQILELRRIIEIYRVRLSKYDLLERYTGVFEYQLHNFLESTYSEIKRNNKPLNDSMFSQLMRLNYKKMTEDQQSIIEFLTEKMVEVTIPPPMWTNLWLIENNIDLYEPKKLSELLGNGVTDTHIEAIMEHSKRTWPDKVMHDEVMLSKYNFWKKVQPILAEIVSCQRRIQEELKVLEGKLSGNFFPVYEEQAFDAFQKLGQQLAAKPEVIDFIYSQFKSIGIEINKNPTKKEVLRHG